MRGRGAFQLAQMRNQDPRVIELCDHLRAAIDILESLASKRLGPESVPSKVKEQVPAVQIRETDKLAFSIREARA